MDLEYRKSRKTQYDSDGNEISTDATTASSGSSGDVISAGQETSPQFPRGKQASSTDNDQEDTE
jgi:hypothetical protein